MRPRVYYIHYCDCSVCRSRCYIIRYTICYVIYNILSVYIDRLQAERTASVSQRHPVSLVQMCMMSLIVTVLYLASWTAVGATYIMLTPEGNSTDEMNSEFDKCFILNYAWQYLTQIGKCQSKNKFFKFSFIF